MFALAKAGWHGKLERVAGGQGGCRADQIKGETSSTDQILTLYPGTISLTWAVQICASKFAGSDPRSAMGMAGG